MTEPTPLTPAQEERVRRMLADARHTEPVPTDVAERLDRVLAGLAAEPSPRSAPEESPSVVPLAAARRRRARTLLVAAAAVVVVGVGATQVLDRAGSGDDSSASSTSGSAGSDAGAGRAGGDPTGSRSLAGESGSETPGSRRPQDGARSLDTSRVFRVRADHFTQDVTRIAGVTATTADTRLDGVPTAAQAARFAGCHPDGWGVGRRIPVIYAGQPGVLIVREPEGETSVVDLFQCGSAEVLRSVTLPVG